MRCVILQARLDSTRLPRKAVLPLGGKPVIYRVMENLRRVVADQYVLACDEASEAELAPIARECGFLCVAGPKEDVLTRFCVVVKKVGADVVLRATGDNPWLFADAAQRTLDRFVELSATPNPPDYFTFTGLPHGSGVEAFSARRLLEACVLTDSAYDHEHVGPAFYRHPERFKCVFETAGEAWYHPEIRTTIDTREDYERACLMNEHLLISGKSVPADTESVIDAWRYVSRPVLFVPQAEPGGGTGHIRRLSGLVAELAPSWRCILYIPLHSPLIGSVTKEARPYVTHVLPESAYLVVLDRFRTSVSEMADFRNIGPVVALDEGGTSRNQADYLLDVIPSLPLSPCGPNLADVAFLPLPLRRREKTVSSVSSALVVAGGENAIGYALPVAAILASMDLEVTVIDPSATGLSKHEKGYTVSGPVQGLRERLCHYDLVVTHYGFTAFEALAAGSRVILFSPSQYHYKLGKKAGFSVLPCGKPEPTAFRAILAKGIKVPGFINPSSAQKRLSDAIGSLLARKSLECPLCGKSQSTVIARSPDRTVSRCEHCGMAYPSFIVAQAKGYDKAYFFEEYRKQYGKTYLEDFSAIKTQGSRRVAVLNSLASRYRIERPGSRSLLDIGCAYGPFLSAALDGGWAGEGLDVCADAVAYVRDELRIPAHVSAFPAPESDAALANRKFDAVTLWFVIEHFEDLEPVFARISTLLRAGGILAFSTPSSRGVSGRFKTASFYAASPSDHYSIWDPRMAKKQLAMHGFTLVRTISTGHHPERFPGMNGIKPGSLRWKLASLVSRLFSLGDTFEVYAIRNGTLEDAV